MWTPATLAFLLFPRPFFNRIGIVVFFLYRLKKKGETNTQWKKKKIVKVRTFCQLYFLLSMFGISLCSQRRKKTNMHERGYPSTERRGGGKEENLKKKKAYEWAQALR